MHFLFSKQTVDNPVAIRFLSNLVEISYFVLIRKIGMNKNRLVLTGIFIEMGVVEIEYELNKINVFTNYCVNLGFFIVQI
jgi:hypothetical protein